MKKKNRGFTIIELVVIVGIVAAIILLMLPALGKTRERAHRIRCVNNLKQLSTAAQLYAADHNGRIPDIAPDPSNPDASLANSDYIDDDEVYVCPRDSRAEDEFGDFKTSYTATLFTPAFLSFQTGSARSILYIESDEAGVVGSDEIDLSDASVRHGGMTVISFVDGSIDFYNTQDIASLERTAQPAVAMAGGRGRGRAVGRPDAPQRDTGGRRVGPEERPSTGTGEPIPTATPLRAGGGPDEEEEYVEGTEAGEEYPEPPATAHDYDAETQETEDEAETAETEEDEEETPEETPSPEVEEGPVVVDRTEGAGGEGEESGREAFGIDPEGGYGAVGGGAEEEGTHTGRPSGRTRTPGPSGGTR